MNEMTKLMRDFSAFPIFNVFGKRPSPNNGGRAGSMRTAVINNAGSLKYSAVPKNNAPINVKRKKVSVGELNSMSDSSSICLSPGVAERGNRRMCRCLAGGISLMSSGKGSLLGKLMINSRLIRLLILVIYSFPL